MHRIHFTDSGFYNTWSVAWNTLWFSKCIITFFEPFATSVTTIWFGNPKTKSTCIHTQIVLGIICTFLLKDISREPHDQCSWTNVTSLGWITVVLSSWPVGKVLLDDLHFVSELSTAALSSEAVSSPIFWHVWHLKPSRNMSSISVEQSSSCMRAHLVYNKRVGFEESPVYDTMTRCTL